MRAATSCSRISGWSMFARMWPSHFRAVKSGRVTIARALVTSPTLLLLDEPFSGVDPMAVHDIQEIILHLKELGLGVLITDHNVRETLSVVDRAYIIDEGRVLSEGSREFLLNDPVAREIYLGHRFSM